MKRIATMALAAATFVAPLGAPMAASAQDWRHNNGRYDRDRNDGRWNRDRDNNGRYNRCDRDRDGDCDRRDRRVSERWDRGRHNGYSYQGRWYYGPPPQAYYGSYEPGYRSWRRGDRLPSYYRDSYSGVDYRAYRLRAPPRGYRWVRDDRGEFLLIGIATGVILSTIINNGRY